MKKTYKILKTIIMLTLLTNIFTIQAQTPQQTKTQTPPEVNPERLRVNQTETIPKDFMHINTPETTQQQLQFKNMVLELTTSRKMTMSLSSDEQVRFRYLSMKMEMTKNMHINMYTAQSPPETIPEPTDGINKYLTIDPNTTEPIRATLRLYMDPEELESGQSTDFEQYTWCYWNGTHWDTTPTRYTNDGFLETNTTHFSVWTIKEQQPKKSREIPTPNILGVHAETKAYNYTDITPTEFKYKIHEKEPIILQFKNSAVYMHSNAPVELEYSAENQNRQRMLRVEVEAGEVLRLEVKQHESKPENVGQPEKTLGFYYEIEPNQTITQARLGYEIDPNEVQSMGIDVEKLSWAFWNGTHWDPIESTLSKDNVLEADTDHFSVWTITEVQEVIVPEEPVVETEEPVEPEPEETGNNQIPIPTVSIAIGVIAVVFVMMRKNQ
ncbi:hypothetical protein ACFL0D_06045 [Thermoproteota archaeon]